MAQPSVSIDSHKWVISLFQVRPWSPLWPFQSSSFKAQETVGDAARDSEWASAQTRPLNWEEGRRGLCHAQCTPFFWKPPWCLGTLSRVLFKAVADTGVSMTREVTHAGTSIPAGDLTLLWADTEQWPLFFQGCFLLGCRGLCLGLLSEMCPKQF